MSLLTLFNQPSAPTSGAQIEVSWVSLNVAAAVTFVSVSASDTAAPVVSDVSTTFAPVTASDTVAPVVTDVTTTKGITTTDTITPVVTDVTTIKGITTTDTITPGITDTSSLGPVVITASDTIAPVVTDVTTVKGITTSDTVTPAITEVSSFGTLAISASDTVTPSVTDTSQKRIDGRLVTYEDNFVGTAATLPDAAKWSFQTGAGGWGNNETQTYTNSAANASLDGSGNLAITAIRDAGGNYTSARLRTLGKIEQQYGRFEARMKLPSGSGLWPAFWMMADEGVYGAWPRNGEIDVIEAANNMTISYGTIHGPTVSAPGTKWSRGVTDHRPSLDDGLYHTFAVEWSATSVSWLVDDVHFGTVYKSDLTADQSWVFDRPFHMLLNLAVGGDFTGGAVVDTTKFPATMSVDYVRVMEPVAYTVPGWAKTETLTDDFSTQDDTKWQYGNANISLVNGRLRIVPTTAYPALNAWDKFDLTASYFGAEIVTVAGGGSSAEQSVNVKNTNGDTLTIAIVGGNTLMCRSWPNGGAQDATYLGYDQNTMRYLRIRESAGSILWETSPDRATWTTRRTLATPFSVTNAIPFLSAGYYDAAQTGITMAEFDNVNLTGAAVIAKSASDTVTPVVSETSATALAGAAQDVVTPTITESSAIAIGGLITLSSTDTLTPVLTEDPSLVTVAVAVTDTVTPVITEQPSTVTPLALSTGQVVFGGATTVVKTDTTSTTLSFVVPDNTVVGDFLVAEWSQNGGTVSSFAGWTVLSSSSPDTTVTNPRVYAYYKVATAAEVPGSTVNVTMSSAVVAAGGMSRYSGVDTSAPIDVAATRASAATGSNSMSHPGVTTVADNAFIITGVGLNSGSATNTLIEPAGFTKRWDLATKRNAYADTTKATPGATGPIVWTSSSTTLPWSSWVASLKPAAAVSAIVKTGSDTLTPAISDASVATLVQITASDTISPVVSEFTQFAPVGFSTSDTITPGVTDTSSFAPVQVTTSDTLTPTVTEASGFGSTAIVASDTVTPIATEQSFFSIVSVSAADTIRPVVTDSSGFGTVAVSATDSITPVVTDSSSLGPIAISASDTVATGFTDTSSIVIVVATADTTTPVITDTSTAPVVSGVIVVAANDTITPTATDSSLVTRPIATTDTVTPVVAESRSFGTTAVSALDTLTPAATEVSSFGTVAVAASDTVTASVVDTSVVASVGTAQDLMSPTLTETSSLLVSGVLTITASDTVTPVVTDTSALVRNTGVVDTTRPIITESTATMVMLSTTDTVRPVVTDTSNVTLAKTASDTITPVVGDEETVTLVLASTDTVRPVITDTPSILFSKSATDSIKAIVTETSLVDTRAVKVNVWNGTAWIKGQIKIWNGSSWVVAKVKRWNGTSWV